MRNKNANDENKKKRPAQRNRHINSRNQPQSVDTLRSKFRKYR